jgi:hydrophobic/amphiphilic exporter-1 (mainly G- bacteria), HAE1 family
MNLSAPFIHRPVMTIVLMSALLIFGLFAYAKLPISELPRVEFPTISVSATLPGANPKNMAASVATPLERRLGGIPGLISMSSSSTTGKTGITLQFELSRDIDAAAQDVERAISQSLRQLPPNMATPPTLSKVNPADFGIVYLALTADTLPLTELDEYAETRVAPLISQVPGVAQVQVFGSYQYATRIFLNPYALSARGLTLDMVSAAIQSNNSNLASGTLYGGSRTYTVESNGQLNNAEAYNRIVVAYQDSAPVHLRDVGEAVDGIQQDKQLTTFSDVVRGDGKMRPAVMLSVRRQPGANTVAVSEGIKAILPRLTRQAPGDAQLQLLYTRGDFIEGSIKDARTTLLLALGLVVAVVYLFLRNWRATLISAVCLPVSLIGTFSVMRLMDFNLDNFSLMALTLATGFIVDDTIVVLENITRFRDGGVKGIEAALLGSKEIAFTVVSMTVSLIAVFIPILLMGGMIGRLFSEFALTVAIAVAISGLVSLTLTPMLCRFLPDSGKHRTPTPFERGFDRLKEFYRRSLEASLNHGALMLCATTATLILTVVLLFTIPKGFIPSEDTGQVIGMTRAADGTTFDELNGMQQKLAKIVAKNPSVATVMSNAGQGWGSTGGNNVGLLYLGLKPAGQRPSGDQIRRQLRKAASVRNLQVYIEDSSALNVNSIDSDSQYQYVLQSANIDSLYQLAPRFEQQLRSIPGLQDVSTDLSLSNPQISIDIRRETASALGVTPEEIQSTLANAYGGQQISTIFGPANEYWVMMQLAPEYQRNINALDALYVTGSNDNLVPLRAVADIRSTVGPLSVSHYGQLPSVVLSFNLARKVSLSEVTGRIQTLARNLLTSEVSGAFAGDAQAYTKSLADLPQLLLITTLVIYMILAILYENFIHPLTILTALPLALAGGLLALMIFHFELNIFSFIGLVLLVGLVKKNGIIMIDFAQQMRGEKQLTAGVAIVAACVVRFRPIMMTTLAAILGTLPIAFGVGMGSETRRPLGVVVAGGLLLSQLLTLYVTPAFFVAMDKLRARAEMPASNWL